jgi:hypothetical protein
MVPVPGVDQHAGLLAAGRCEISALGQPPDELARSFASPVQRPERLEREADALLAKDGPACP